MRVPIHAAATQKTGLHTNGRPFVGLWVGLLMCSPHNNASSPHPFGLGAGWLCVVRFRRIRLWLTLRLFRAAALSTCVPPVGYCGCASDIGMPASPIALAFDRTRAAPSCVLQRGGRVCRGGRHPGGSTTGVVDRGFDVHRRRSPPLRGGWVRDTREVTELILSPPFGGGAVGPRATHRWGCQCPRRGLVWTRPWRSAYSSRRGRRCGLVCRYRSVPFPS